MKNKNKNIKRIKNNIFVTSLIVVILAMTVYLVNRINTSNELIHGMNISEIEIFQSLTSQMINEAIIIEHGDVESRRIAEGTIEDTIKQRKEIAISLINKDPAKFIHHALTGDLGVGLLENHDGVEKITEKKGKIEIICTKETNDHAETQVFLIDEENNAYMLFAPYIDLMEELVTGDEVIVNGFAIDEYLVANTVSDNDNLSIVNAAAPLASAAAVNRVAFILVNWNEVPTIPFTEAQIRTAMTTVKGHIEESSLGTTTIAGRHDPLVDIYGNYLVNYNNCDYRSWHTQGVTAATRDGMRAADYRHIILLFPRPPAGCESGIAGRGTLGGTSIWQYGNISIGTIIHEMGHNYGLHHARSATCTEGTQRVQISNTCTFAEYGDPFDLMGSSGGRNHFQAFSKNAIGWMPNANVRTVTANGIYDLFPIQFPTTQTQLLRIPVTGFTPTGLPQTFTYLLDFRQPSPFDVYQPSAAAVNGVVIRNGTNRGAFTNLYNANAAAGTAFATNAPLRQGQTFYDPMRDVLFRTVSVNTTRAQVEVVFGGGGGNQCVAAAPTVTVTPTSQRGVHGETLRYSITVRNNDNAHCATAPFTLINSVLPNGFQMSNRNFSFNLAPGASHTEIVDVTTTNAAAAANHALSFTARNTLSTMTAAVSFTYQLQNVTATCQRGIPAITITPAENTGLVNQARNYTVTVRNTDTPACNGNMKFSLTAQAPNGFAITNGTANFNLKAGDSNTRTITVTPNATVLPGTYNIGLTASNNDSGVRGTENMIYIVQGITTTTTTTTTALIPPTTTTAAPCVRANPTITLAPANQTGEVGQTVTYTLTIRNNDNAQCASATFNISHSMTGGFTVQASRTSIALTPGATGTITYNVTPAMTVANGSYPLSLTITESGRQFTASANYNVTSSVGVPPAITVTGITAGTRIPNGNNNIRISATHARGIASIVVRLNNNVLRTCTNVMNCDVQVHANNLAAGTHTLVVEAYANDVARTMNTRPIQFTR